MKLVSALLVLPLVAAWDAALSNPQQQLLKTEGVGDWFSSKEFDALVESILDTWHVPGLSIAIIDSEKILSKVSNLTSVIQAPAESRIGLWLRPTS
jgi:hypothetical protein